MGEAKRRRELAECVGLETVGGRLQVRWDDTAAATVHGQMAFFIEFLTVSGLFNRWTADCPVSYQSPNGSEPRDVLGTWLLSILSGHWRYAHIAALRSDGVNPSLLGMRKVVSDDTLRRALSSLDETPAVAWLNAHLKYATAPLLTTPWILDTDVTVKPIYGKQEGAIVGYNPKKPGRPSHAYHTYQVSGLRLMLGVDVRGGPGISDYRLSEEPALMGEVIARQRSSDEKTEKKSYGGVQGEGGVGGAEGRQNAGGVGGEV